MKKFIGLLIIVLFTANLFGQKQHLQLSRFRTYPSYIDVDETRVWCAQKGGDLNEYLKTRTYSFYGENGKLYLISYADTLNIQNFPVLHYGEKIERNLYLLRYDNGKWNVASDIIQTDYNGCTSNGEASYSYTYLSKTDIKDLLYVKNGVSNGYVKKLDNGNVEIRLLIIISDNGHDDDYYWKTWRFTPKSDGTYDIKEIK